MGRVIKVLGKSHTVDLLKLLKANKDGVQFNQMKNALSIDAKTVTRRLRELQDIGLVEGRRGNSSSVYWITSSGIRVLELLLKIEK